MHIDVLELASSSSETRMLRRVEAISEIGYSAYLCGESLQRKIALNGFPEAVLKLLRTMCTQPVATTLRTNTLHSVTLMCRDCLDFQERACDAGILTVASQYLTDKTPSVRKCSASLLFVLFVGNARILREACSMSELTTGLQAVANEDWRSCGSWSCNEADQALMLLALGERSAGTSNRRIAKDL